MVSEKDVDKKQKHITHVGKKEIHIYFVDRDKKGKFRAMEIAAILNHAKETIKMAKNKDNDGLFGLRCDAAMEDIDSIKSLILDDEGL